MLSCKEKTYNNQKLNYNIYSDQIICWNGIYYLHAFLSIFTSLTFFFICFIVKKTCFETKNSPNNLSAKLNSNSDIFLLIEKCIIVSLFTLGKDLENQWLLIAILFFCSGIVFFSYLINLPFYNKYITKVN
jgi:hypothetical protein